MGHADRHLDLIDLDALRAGDAADPQVAAHLATCADCRADLEALRELAHDLRALHEPVRVAAPSRDAQIRWLTRMHATRIRKADVATNESRWLAARPTWAAAAAIVLALGALLMMARRPESPPLTRVASAPQAETGRAAVGIAADLDGDGRITVLDAFALARKLEAADRSGAVDVTHDTRVDQDDVDALLAMAVSLKGGT